MTDMTKIQNIPTQARKSVKLTKDECKALRAFRKGFGTDAECADALGIKRVTYLRVLMAESGSQRIIETIREKLSEVTV